MNRKTLAANHPTEFYALLAAGHLWELSEDWMKERSSIKWNTPKPTTMWTLPEEVGQSEHLTDAAQLNQLGYVSRGTNCVRTTEQQINDTTFAINARLVS